MRRDEARAEQISGQKQRGLEQPRGAVGGDRVSRARNSPDLRPERRGSETDYPEREWEYQGHEWDQPGYERLGPDSAWDQPGYGGKRQGYQWEHQRGEDLGRAGRAGQSARGPANHPGEGSYRGYGPKGYQRSDERIREDVCEALTWHPGVNASEIDVGVENGQVSLQGTVENRGMKRMAEECAATVSGVIDVDNRLRLAQSLRHQDQARMTKQGGNKSRSQR